MKDPEPSESGAPILRHEPRERDFELAFGDSESAERIAQHIREHIGDPANVFHELVSDLIHVDVHMVKPTESRNYYTLVTTGMSDRPMSAPSQFESFRYAELLICLPPSWRLAQADFEDEVNYWPIRWLKLLARFPHVFDTWLWLDHTVPNGDPPEPYAGDTELCCALMGIPLLFGDEFTKVRISEEKTVYFLSLIPVYQEEMEFKLKRGANALWKRLGNIGVTELLDVSRKNACKRRPFRLN